MDERFNTKMPAVTFFLKIVPDSKYRGVSGCTNELTKLTIPELSSQPALFNTTHKLAQAPSLSVSVCVWMLGREAGRRHKTHQHDGSTRNPK